MAEAMTSVDMTISISSNDNDKNLPLFSTVRDGQND